MKKFLFPLVALLLLAACSSSEESDSFKYQIDSSIQVDNLKLQSYIFEGNYYIEAIDDSGNDVFYHLFFLLFGDLFPVPERDLPSP